MIAKDKILRELVFRAVRSSGKGGQNVNKVSTKVELRFHIFDSECFSQEEKMQILSRLQNRISKEGFLVLSAETERTQLANKKQVVALFFDMLEKALIKPKKRVKTKPTRASKEKRLRDKKQLSDKKKFRRLH